MPLPGDVPSAEQVTPKKKEPFFYGGQAVIEGVMMRGKRYYAVAVRLPTTKEIVIDRGELKAPIYTNRFWKVPFVRGVALIGEQLHLGMRSLMWSANMNAGSRDIEISKKEITGSVAVALVFALALFIGLPLLLAGVTVHKTGGFLFVLVEGVIRVGLVLGYLALIALLPDVRRVFQYHGAEHKTINAFESGWPLEVSSVRRASRVLAIPVIAGLGFESIRFMARHRDNPIIWVLLLPVLGTQKFTTREPSDDMLEVAIAAFNSAREGEEQEAAA